MTQRPHLIERLRNRSKAWADLCEVASHIGVFPLDCCMIDSRLEAEAADALATLSAGRDTNAAPQGSSGRQIPDEGARPAVAAIDGRSETCQRLGCRFDVAQSLLDRAKERGELSETERASAVREPYHDVEQLRKERDIAVKACADCEGELQRVNAALSATLEREPARRP